MSRYVVKIKNNQVVGIEGLDDEADELLGVEWAMSEAKDSYRYSKNADGDYTVTNRTELAEFVTFIGTLLGQAALGKYSSLDSVP